VNHIAHWKNQPTKNENQDRIMAIAIHEKISPRKGSTQGQHKLKQMELKRS
jgi:hypothetical protein